MMTLDDVTVIIPAVVKTDEQMIWLLQAIESVRDNGCKMIVADNGGHFLNDLQCNDVQIVAALAKSGVSYTRNCAVQSVTTKLFLPLDCDDMLAKDAISKMLEAYNDTGYPVYSDIEYFGIKNVSHYALLDFSCELVKQKVSIAPVTVLQSVDQWKSIGGWDETIEFYEDGEYNARLFLRYCGVLIPEPLLKYRQHSEQRTRKYSAVEKGLYTNEVMSRIRRITMSCPGCGGKRRSRTTTTESTTVSMTPALVLSDTVDCKSQGKVYANYVGGKGRGPHYYRGVFTKFPYRVEYGQSYCVDPNDAIEQSQVGVIPVFFIKIPDPVAPVPEVVQPEVVAEVGNDASPFTVSVDDIGEFAEEPELKRTPVTSVPQRTPVEDKKGERKFRH
jgi:hypothetical protein